jgi:hypothetical protein
VLLRFVEERADGGLTFSKRRYTSGGCVGGWMFFAAFRVIVELSIKTQRRVNAISSSIKKFAEFSTIKKSLREAGV